jgi:hypothetical protein
MLSTRQLYRSNNQPANYAALTQFAPEPPWTPCGLGVKPPSLAVRKGHAPSFTPAPRFAIPAGRG